MALSEQHVPRKTLASEALKLRGVDPGTEVPSRVLLDQGLGDELAYELISSELLLDGQARLNLATFVTTWMPSTAAKLMAETADKNIIDKDEYPQTAAIEARCVNMLAELWNSPQGGSATGCSTTGSSEAAMLAGMAMKWRWRKRMQEAGKPTDRPNLVTGINVQVCWEKFCRYWEVEPRLVPMEGNRFHLDAEQAAAQCDENTIGVVSVLGSTYDGSYEPVSRDRRGSRPTGKREGPGRAPARRHRPPAASSAPSCSPSSVGTSAFRACCRSTHRDTSTALCIPASAGRSGATRRRFLRS